MNNTELNENEIELSHRVDKEFTGGPYGVLFQVKRLKSTLKLGKS